MQPPARLRDAHHLGERAARVGERLQDVPADDEIELRGTEGERERVAHLEEGPVSEACAAIASANEMRLLQIDPDEGRSVEAPGEARDDLARAAPDVEYKASRRGRMPGEKRLLLRPDRLRLRGEVPHHRLVRHLLRLRAARMHGWRFYVARPPLQPELLQVMIDVFVHRLAPLPPRHRTEERVRLVARGLGAALDELRDQVDEFLPLRREVALVSDDERWIRRTVAAERFLAEDRLSEERHQDLADQLLLHRM